jgi:diguanylate cyclase
MEHFLASRNMSNGILLEVIKLIKGKKILPTPINYAVLYEYVMGKNTHLIKIVNESFNSKDGFTDVVGYRLYQQFLKNIPEDMAQVSDDIMEASQNLLKTLKKTEEHLEEHLTLIKTDTPLENIEKLKGKLIDTKAQAAEAITKANQATNQINHVSTMVNRDPVTKLRSMVKLQEDYKNLISTGARPCIIIFDLDGFSEVNKAHGMLVSENFLRIVGAKFKTIVGSKHAYRISGQDEFCVMTGGGINDPTHQTIINELTKEIGDIKIVSKTTREVLIKNITFTAVKVEGNSQFPNVSSLLETGKQEMGLTKKEKRIKRRKDNG